MISVPRSMHRMAIVPSGSGKPTSTYSKNGIISGILLVSVYAMDLRRLSKIRRPERHTRIYFVSLLVVQNKLQTKHNLNKSVEQDNKANNTHLQLSKFTMKNTNKNTYKNNIAESSPSIVSHSKRPLNNMTIGTLTPDGYVVTFDTAKRGGAWV